MKYGGDGDISCNSYTRYKSQMIGKVTGILENNKSSGDHSNKNIGKNTKKSPGDLLSFKLQWKTIS